MAWWHQRAVALLTLVILAGSPAVGTVCAMWCAPEPTSVAAAGPHNHHQAAATQDHHGSPDTRLQTPEVALRLAAIPLASCDTNHAAGDIAATLTASRPDSERATVGSVCSVNASAYEVTIPPYRARDGVRPPGLVSAQHVSLPLRI
jgi:hypothetical protein